MNEAQIQHYSRPLRAAVHLAAWVYLLWVVGQALLVPLPPLVMVDHLGLGALTALTLCLACTPINIVFNFPPVRRLRRNLGLYAFFFASLHLLALLFWIEGWNGAVFWEGVINSWPQQIGLVAFCILLLLAITSLKGLRRLLRRNWKRLHRLSYVAGVLGALHLLGAPSAPNGLGVTYLLVILLLLGVRLPPVKAWFIGKHRTAGGVD